MPDDTRLSDWELSPAEVKSMLDAGRPVLLLDCRNPQEVAAASIEAATVVPMQDIPGRVVELEDLAEGRDVVVMCHLGQRSLQVVAWLRRQGEESGFEPFARARSMAGGIERWSTQVDPAVPRY